MWGGGDAAAFDGAACGVFGRVGCFGWGRAFGWRQLIAGGGLVRVVALDWGRLVRELAPIGSVRPVRLITDRRSHDGHVIRYPRTCTGLYRHTDYCMGKQVSVYVRDEDLALWERAEAHARRHRMPVSGLVMTALEEYLARHSASDSPRPPQ